ncbi:MAG: alpha-hydroxy-acid oxidizing protein [Desulfovibrionaceae bacterium]|nr:alpha-hydroxy-acid oxidizing protein [Desulfovibrionaceae bacterium]
MSEDFRANAKQLMQGFCRVCPICNGRACIGEVPGMGGLGTAASFHNNVAALAKITLNMSALHGVTAPKTNTTFLGTELKMPILAAPIGGAQFNMSKGFDEEAYIEAVLAGCEDVGSLGCTGDGVPAFIIDAAVKSLSQHKGIPFIKPWEGKELYEKIDRVLACKPVAVGMDVDAAGLVTLRKMGRPVAPMPVSTLSEVVSYVHKHNNTPFIVKGIMTPGDAEKAITAGADAIVVSNHGGRILDHCPGTADVLPAIAAVVHKRIQIAVDGGVRSGTDVLKLLALGADVVLIGRPVCVASVGGGREGVKQYFTTLNQQLNQAMLLTGVENITSITNEIIYHV